MEKEDMMKFRKAVRGLTLAVEALADLANKYGHDWYHISDDAFPFMDVSIYEVEISCREWTGEINKRLEVWPDPRQGKRKLPKSTFSEIGD